MFNKSSKSEASKKLEKLLHLPDKEAEEKKAKAAAQAAANYSNPNYVAPQIKFESYLGIALILFFLVAGLHYNFIRKTETVTFNQQFDTYLFHTTYRQSSIDKVIFKGEVDGEQVMFDVGLYTLVSNGIQVKDGQKTNVEGEMSFKVFNNHKNLYSTHVNKIGKVNFNIDLSKTKY